MESLPVVEVDLSLAPRDRWEDLRPHLDALRELAVMYERDLAIARPFRDMLALYRDQQDPAYLEEIEAIAAMAKIDPLDLFLVNAYYDVFKHAMGCTAFALDTDEGPLHARNLDWHSEARALERHTIRVRYREGSRLLFESVTWPGFVGTLSGVAPGRFAVTLNAVLSEDPAEVATPIAFVLRDLLIRASYDEAVRELSARTLSCDCLLLVSGTESKEMVVIERSPRRSAIRGPEDGVLVVTNDYKQLDDGARSAETQGDALAATSCGRFDRALLRVRSERPHDAAGCLSILGDPKVQMSITVQQMVFSARHGLRTVRRPLRA